MSKTSWAEFTPDERKEWLGMRQTQAFLARVKELAADNASAAVSGLAQGYPEALLRVNAGSARAYDTVVSLAEDIV